MVERRKNSNWFSRTLGSVRSSSTAYSSNGIFKRNRHNSVYSSPEAGIIPGQQLGVPPPQKMSLYDKYVGRKSSLRNQRHMMKRGNVLSLLNVYSVLLIACINHLK